HLPNLKVLNLSHSEKLIKTPDFDGLPCLERIKLYKCVNLTDVHPSIGYHERLIYVDMSYCTHLKKFPPIIGMKKLETLILSWCPQLCMFPEIQTNMDNMVELSLRGSRIKVVPSSFGKYCTNLLSLDLGYCKSLKSIEGNFHHLKHLKKFFIARCKKLKIPPEGLFDVTCCLEVLHLFGTSFKNLHPGIVSMKFPGFPPSLKRLHLVSCDWINGDISSVFCELSNLQVLNLQHNDFSRLHCSLLQLCSLKVLNLSYCCDLVELPDLPSSIAVLQAYQCKKLKLVDLPTDLKWLWRISLPMNCILGDMERKVQSMLQGNSIYDNSISLSFHVDNIRLEDFARRRLMLELPRNWYNKFSGFLICLKVEGMIGNNSNVITIEDVMGRENEDVLEVSDDETFKWIRGKGEVYKCYIYISCSSLRHTSWWKSTHTTISFSIQRGTFVKVELVPRSKGDPIERVKHTTNSSEFWDRETIEITHDSKSCIKINWCPNDMPNLFYNRNV
ncbi:Leucine-rich repeat-containing protein, partial [Cynara cardunculus var. scolymus]